MRAGRHNFDFCEVFKVPLLEKPEGGGQKYWFAFGDMRNHWHPSYIIGNLRDEDMRLVIQGPQSRATNVVVGVECAMTDDYDHQRHSAQKLSKMIWHTDGRSMNKWRFIITRNDDTKCWLEPAWSDNKVRYGEFVTEGQSPLAPPQTGPGGSDFRGQYKQYKQARTDKVLQFAKFKNVPAATAVAA